MSWQDIAAAALSLVAVAPSVWSLLVNRQIQGRADELRRHMDFHGLP